MEQNTEQKAKPSTHAQYIGVLIYNNRYCDIPTTSSLLERSSSSPATNNAIRGAEQTGNIAKQWFCWGRCQRLEVSWKQGEGLTIKMGSAAYNDSIEKLSMAMIVKVSKGMVILPKIPQGRRTVP